MSASLMPSMCLTSARRLLPCATTSRRWPRATAGLSTFSHMGSTRVPVDLVLSVSGSSEGARCA